MEALHEVLLMDVFINPDKIPHNVTHAFLASLILIIIAIVINRSIRLVPRGIQNFVEVIVDAMLKLVNDNIGHRWGREVFPFICTIFIFILVCNFMGLIPGLASATANVNTNAAMAVPVFITYQFYGLRIHGVKYIYHFLGPIRSITAIPLMILMFVVEVISHLARPFTLTIRLFGNMTAKHVLLLILAMIAPIIAPALILGLGVLVAVVQAFVFTLLSVCYFAGAVEEAH